jgi:lipid II:glycine glycyltransferase (peptidoglycan interpeptide bridge formation enzyme)
MHLLQWKAFLKLRELGVRRFDFCGVRVQPNKGSKQDGISGFKMRFGGNFVQGYMWKYSFNRLKYAAYSLAVRLLKAGDVVDQERHKMLQSETNPV